MFIPDPNFFRPGSRKIPDPGSGSASKNLSILDPKNSQKIVSEPSWSGMFIPDPDLDFFTHPRSRGQKGLHPDPQHCLYYSCPRRAGTSRWYYVRTGMRCKIDDWISQSRKDTRMHDEFKRERNILLIFPKRKLDLVSINRWIITGDPRWEAEVSQTPVSSRGRCSEDHLHPHGVLHHGESAIAQVLLVFFLITRGQLPYLR